MPVSTSLGAVGEFAASRHGAVTRNQAARLGLGHQAVARLLDRKVLLEPVPGVLHIAGAPSTWERRLYTATLECSSHAQGEMRIAIAASAARLHLVDGFLTDTSVRVAARRGAATRAPDVTVTQTLHQYVLDDDEFDSDLTIVHGIPCTTLARTLCDIARYHPQRYERAVDDFVRRGYSIDWLVRTADRVPMGGRWRRVLAADLERRRGGRLPDSWFERLVEACLHSPVLPSPVRQFEVRRGDGSLVGRVDLAFPHLRLAVEAHSRKFHTGPTREAFDQHREQELAAEGWLTTYVGWAEATGSPAAVRRSIERIAARRAADLGVALLPSPNAVRPAAGR